MNQKLDKDNAPNKVVPYERFLAKRREKKYGKTNLPRLTPEEITAICTPEVGYDDESPS